VPKNKPNFLFPRGGVDNALHNIIPNTQKVSPDWYKPYNITINTTPWYRDITTWLWIGGVAGSI